MPASQLLSAPSTLKAEEAPNAVSMPFQMRKAPLSSAVLASDHVYMRSESCTQPLQHKLESTLSCLLAQSRSLRPFCMVIAIWALLRGTCGQDVWRRCRTFAHLASHAIERPSHCPAMLSPVMIKLPRGNASWDAARAATTDRDARWKVSPGPGPKRPHDALVTTRVTRISLQTLICAVRPGFEGKGEMLCHYQRLVLPCFGQHAFRCTPLLR